MAGARVVPGRAGRSGRLRPAQLDQRLIYLMIAAMIVYSLSQAMCEWVVGQPAGGVGPRSAR